MVGGHPGLSLAIFQVNIDIFHLFQVLIDSGQQVFLTKCYTPDP